MTDNIPMPTHADDFYPFATGYLLGVVSVFLDDGDTEKLRAAHRRVLTTAGGLVVDEPVTVEQRAEGLLFCLGPEVRAIDVRRVVAYARELQERRAGEGR